MLNIRVEQQSPFQVRFPIGEQRSAVVALAKSYLAEEQSRPLEQQNPFTPTIEALLQQILDYEVQIVDGEAQRALAADAVRRLEPRSKTLVSSMMKTIAATYPDQPVKAQEWGFRTKNKTNNILTPRNQKERLAVIDSYIAKEQSRPPEARFTVPALNEVITLYHEFLANLQARNAGQTKREAGISAGNALAKRLAQYLQLAAGAIVGLEYDLKITPDLQKWGFNVVERRRSNKRDRNGSTPANGSTNGSNGISESEPELIDQDG